MYPNKSHIFVLLNKRFKAENGNSLRYSESLLQFGAAEDWNIRGSSTPQQISPPPNLPHFLAPVGNCPFLQTSDTSKIDAMRINPPADDFFSDTLSQNHAAPIREPPLGEPLFTHQAATYFSDAFSGECFFKPDLKFASNLLDNDKERALHVMLCKRGQSESPLSSSPKLQRIDPQFSFEQDSTKDYFAQLHGQPLLATGGVGNLFCGARGDVSFVETISMSEQSAEILDKQWFKDQGWIDPYGSPSSSNFDDLFSLCKLA